MDVRDEPTVFGAVSASVRYTANESVGTDTKLCPRWCESPFERHCEYETDDTADNEHSREDEYRIR